MAYYAIIAQDAENSLNTRLEQRPAHLERLEKLDHEGRLLIAGPHPNTDVTAPNDAGFSGSLIVAEFESLDAAESWAAEDPYKLAGVYASVLVKPFLKVFPK